MRAQVGRRPKTEFTLPSLTQERFDLGSSTLRHFVAKNIPHSMVTSNFKHNMSGRAHSIIKSVIVDSGYYLLTWKLLFQNIIFSVKFSMLQGRLMLFASVLNRITYSLGLCVCML